MINVIYSLIRSFLFLSMYFLILIDKIFLSDNHFLKDLSSSGTLYSFFIWGSHKATIWQILVFSKSRGILLTGLHAEHNVTNMRLFPAFYFTLSGQIEQLIGTTKLRTVNLGGWRNEIKCIRKNSFKALRFFCHQLRVYSEGLPARTDVLPVLQETFVGLNCTTMSCLCSEINFRRVARQDIKFPFIPKLF